MRLKPFASRDATEQRQQQGPTGNGSRQHSEQV